MTIFRSKPKTLTMYLSNFRVGGLSILTEPWAEDFQLQPGDKLKIDCELTDLEDVHNPLNFEVWDDGSGISIWSPPQARLEIVKGQEQ